LRLDARDPMRFVGGRADPAASDPRRSVQRIWAAHGLKPHRVRTFKLSNDAKFAAKSLPRT
jgi:hypothetical protein